MPLRGERLHAKINDAESTHVLHGRVASREVKVIQIQLLAAERHGDRPLHVMTARIAFQELSHVLPTKPRL
jgi:hypothetical protein